MTNKDALKLVYDIVYNSTYFSIRELKSAGLSKTQIDRFVGLGILDTRVADRASQLFNLGCSLSYARMHEYALKCFDKSSDMAPRNKTLQEQIFSNSLFCGNVEHSFKYFARYYDSSNTIHNMYLYLMNMCMDLPREYQDVINIYSIEDISGYGNSGTDGKNGIRKNIVKYIFDKDISYAYGAMKGLESENNVKDLNLTDKSVLYLLKHAKRYQKALANNAYKMILDGDYLGLIQLYDGLEKAGKLINHNSLILKLAKEKINIENDREVYSIDYNMDDPIDLLLSSRLCGEVIDKVNEKGKTADEYIKVITKELEDIGRYKKDEVLVTDISNHNQSQQPSSSGLTGFDKWLEDNPVWKSKEGKILDQALYVGPYAVTLTKTRKN